jgi:DNA-binding NarL/FixJ family response regulator
MFKTLIIEDNATFRQTLKTALCMRFPLMNIHEAEDGRKALREADAFVPNLIFMDIKLPDSNGLKLAKTIKTNHSKIIIIVLTNYDLPEYREAAFQSGANYFLSKSSTSSEEILELVDSILSDSERIDQC